MPQNILITGAAGYIGGSIIADILSRNEETLKIATMFAAVRSQEQVDQISKIGVKAIQVDLNDKSAIEDTIIDNKIDIVVHTASGMHPAITSNLISALGKRRQASGSGTYLIHDSDSILAKEREIGFDNPVRAVNRLLAEEGKNQGVETFNVAVPMTYGRGTGECRKLSVNNPAMIRTSIKLKTVHKFDKDGHFGTVHISDLTDIYVRLVSKILKQEPIQIGQDRYFFAIAHKAHWWKMMDKVAEGLYSRGLVTEPKAKIYVRAMTTHSGQLVPENVYALGWKPKWDSEEKFLNQIDDEIKDVQELDTVKMSLFDSLVSEQSK
ncbi:hypothetical protein FGSG_03560 [Fusarium graminearum PH-1]|uniref:hypothetical protein n=1 Tax=Gibberella zeae (strain ATCC MYA-4620 / CBS 123657 / FGSC 9075 / NRRL 31084 / PH-1) TaxID=229533 RepID=UPI00021F18EB|nr:hypothetical protein FGSG_03560 [Fusarium graminearum PH-1]ESU09649.1 hypothetical protein FGSG_03560 [Fusarium graminearum PH-1]|eukprot:XP_011322148.1 hypothetical protein FGSG_03560 [Fusarium graminearum PH-1]